MSGTVSIDRGLFDHGVFRAEPFSEREAWVWMIMAARWKAGKVRVGDYVVELSRGEFAASVRFMASAWDWTAAKVQRYLERLKKMEMISVKTDTGVSVITVCNYDKFQPSAEASDTGPIQDRYKEEEGCKKDISREEVTNVTSVHSEPDQVKECVAHFNAVAQRIGWPTVQSITKTRRAALSQRIREVGGGDGWRDAIDRAALSPLLTGQNGRGWRADFDWICKPANFTKLMEGNYDPRTPNPTHDARNLRPGDGRGTVDAFAAVAARYSGRTQ